jgi:hypothetical protein
MVCRIKAEPRGFYGEAMLLEWIHTPGFLPRPLLIVNDHISKDTLQALAAATPEHRFWFCLSPAKSSSGDLPETVRNQFPSVRPVRGPVHVPQRSQGLQPEPAVDLWLLELDGPPAAAANADSQ